MHVGSSSSSGSSGCGSCIMQPSSNHKMLQLCHFVQEAKVKSSRSQTSRQIVARKKEKKGDLRVSGFIFPMQTNRGSRKCREGDTHTNNNRKERFFSRNSFARRIKNFIFEMKR